MTFRIISLLIFLSLCSTGASAQKYLSKENPEIETTWKDQSFSSEKTLVKNLEKTSGYTTISKALEDRKIVDALQKEEMVTIFVFSDNAFSKLDDSKRKTILGDKNKMDSVIKYMIVPGRIDKNGLQTAVQKHNGKAYLKTLNGEELGITERGGTLYLINSKGQTAAITDTNFYHKNGLFHMVDGLVLPASVE